MAIYADRKKQTTSYEQNEEQEKYLGTSYILTHKSDFEPGRTNDFTFKVKFTRDLYDPEGEFVATAADASEDLALSIGDFTGPQMSLETLSIRTGNGTVNYASNPSIANSAITFHDYIGKRTEDILFAWYSMAHNILTDKIGFKEYYSNDGILYKWAPNGTRKISWWLLGCWINEFNLGQFSKRNPDERTLSTNIIYDRAIPYIKTNKRAWTVNEENRTSNATNTEYTDASAKNYIGTQSKPLTNNQ